MLPLTAGGSSNPRKVVSVSTKAPAAAGKTSQRLIHVRKS